MTETPFQTLERSRVDSGFKGRLWAVAVAATVLACGFELWWFARTCFNEIDYDGVGYIGIARHIRAGQFYAAINSIRSPMISWLIAAGSFFSADYLLVGKIVNIASFLFCLALVYALTESLWSSRLAAAIAALLFALGRGLAAATVESITPDFLFAALALVYFLLLLQALRKDRPQDWFLVGAVHALAFLSKAFALPWMAVCTFVALILSSVPTTDQTALAAEAPGRSWKTRLIRLVTAALIPTVIAGGWAGVLHSKYGVYTFGSQFRLNLVQWTLGAAREHRDPTYAVLTDTTKDYDEYIVLDMPPGSWMWTYHIDMKRALPKIVGAEIRNVPRVAKELTIVETPGAMLAFLLALAALVRKRLRSTVEWRFGVVSAVAVVSLVTAYSMLVVDARYLYPLLPLILAVAAGFLAGNDDPGFRLGRKICVALVVAGVVFSLTYRSSPFRTLNRDFQVSCRDAGNQLRAHRSARFVSLGAGPFPEHGVGWEAGFKAAYFGGSRIVATTDSLPDATQLTILPADIRKASPDAIIVWAKPDNIRRVSLLQTLLSTFPHQSSETIVDPSLGEVGLVIFR